MRGLSFNPLLFLLEVCESDEFQSGMNFGKRKNCLRPQKKAPIKAIPLSSRHRM
jgi:hypothetical protein